MSWLKPRVYARQSHPSTLEFTAEAADSKVFGTLFSKRVRAPASCLICATTLPVHPQPRCFCMDCQGDIALQK